MDFLLFTGAGNTLALSELEARIGSVSQVYPSIYKFSHESLESAIQVTSILGSSIKLAQKQSADATNLETLIPLLTHKNFSITILGQNNSQAFLNQKVKDMRDGGRFILAEDPFGLSPIILSKHKVNEFFISEQEGDVWQTVWIHNFKHWIKKDRFMPFSNAKAGILPPKIARSMVNLAPDSAWGKGKLLVDPFCGSGRVLVEASELGFKVAGSDILQSQCQETKKNLEYLGIDGDISLLDATHLSQKYRNQIDLIVTEPFLGKPKPRPDRIKYIVPGLEKLYLGCLKDWYSCLKSGGIIVMVFPSFNDGKKDYKTSNIIDEKLKLSYNQLNHNLFYSRPNAEVRREIVVLQKKS